MFFGAAEDAAKTADPMVAKAKMDLAVLAGFDAIRLTAIWRPGDRELTGYELLATRNAVDAADPRASASSSPSTTTGARRRR
jgi:hypothetical protein